MEKKIRKDPAMHEYTTSLLKKSEDLREEGYTENFVFAETGLKASGSGKIYQPEDLQITKHYRFEGESDPGDMTILYAIETVDGIKGTVVDAFGTYADPDLGEFIQKVHNRTYQNNPGANQYGLEEE